MTNESMHRYGP
jgi:hypothetical protein